MSNCFAPKLCKEWEKQEVKDLLHQLVQDNENVEVLTRLGRLYMGETINHAIALHYLRQAYDISKETGMIERDGEKFASLDVTMAFAEFHMLRGEYEEAKSKFWQAMQIDWSHTPAHDGMKLARIGNPADSKVCKNNGHCKGVLRTIFPDQPKLNISVERGEVRSTGEMIVKLIPA